MSFHFRPLVLPFSFLLISLYLFDFPLLNAFSISSHRSSLYILSLLFSHLTHKATCDMSTWTFFLQSTFQHDEMIGIKPNEGITVTAKSIITSDMSGDEMILPILPGPPIALYDGASSTPHALQDCSHPQLPVPSCPSCCPLIEIVSREERQVNPTANGTVSLVTSEQGSTKRDRSRTEGLIDPTMVYNEYGELVEESSFKQPPEPTDPSVTQLLRVIKKGYHHDVSIFPPVDNTYTYFILSFIICYSVPQLNAIPPYVSQDSADMTYIVQR